MTQQQLADFADVSQSYISKVEAGPNIERRPTRRGVAQTSPEQHASPY
jgi:predicted transcriptional regulator